MPIRLRPISLADPAERTSFIHFLTTNTFPFHVGTAPTVSDVEKRIADGDFEGPDHALLGIYEEDFLVGTIVLDDLDDGELSAPFFDLRLAENARGRGLGTTAIALLVDHIFVTYPKTFRIEGQTRDDNHVMRRALLKNGFVKEAHYRKCWPADGEMRDSIGYGILRADRDSGTTTPLIWDDFPRV